MKKAMKRTFLTPESYLQVNIAMVSLNIPTSQYMIILSANSGRPRKFNKPEICLTLANVTIRISLLNQINAKKIWIIDSIPHFYFFEYQYIWGLKIQLQI